MPTLSAQLESAGIDPERFLVAWIKGHEELSQLYAFEVRLVGVTGAILDESGVLGSAARLVLAQDGEPTRYVHGIVQRIESDLHAESGSLCWDLTLAPRAFALSLGHTTEITMESPVPDIVSERLQRFGLKQGEDFELSLRSQYEPREFVVQFRESHASFVSRLTEHLGISFYFRQTKEREVLAFVDANDGFVTEQDGLKLPFRARGEEQDVFELRAVSNLVASQVAVRDYNYRTPGVSLSEGESTESKWGEQFEYGAHFKTPTEAAAMAQVRAEELRCQRRVYHGKSARPELSPGARITVEGHPSGDKKLLITSVTHTLEQSALAVGGGTGGGSGSGGANAYRNSFTAIDADVPFRPPRRTPKPNVSGVLTAVVETEQKGPYSQVDGDGRYRVRFAFDRSNAEHGKASRPIRMAQPHAGAGYGFHFPLRDGVEVLITCVEGDPDRPVIAGAIPNPTTPSTVTEGNAVRNVIRTGGGTEINIDDTEGGERLKITVPYGDTVLQLGAPNAPDEGIYASTQLRCRIYSVGGMALSDKTRFLATSPNSTVHGRDQAVLTSENLTEVHADAMIESTAPTIKTRAGATIFETAPTITSSAGATWTASAGAMVIIHAGGSVTVKAPNVTVEGSTVDVKGDNVNVNGSAVVNVNSSGAVNISGGPIKLNS